MGVAHRVARLGRQHPGIAVLGNGTPAELLRLAETVLVRGVDEVHAGVARMVDDAARFLLVGRVAEHPGAETERRVGEAAGDPLAALEKAPCRDKLFQYLLISVVAVSVKKKIE